MSQTIYLDNAATTPLSEQVLEEMMPYLKDSYGNPSSVYDLGVANKSALLTARKRIAKTLNCANPQNIYFTSGGTESDNWAIIGTAEQCKKNGNHIITSKIEHHAVLNTCAYLEERGFEITYLDVDEQGFIKPEKLLQALRKDTILVSIMTANNEIGTIQAIPELASLVKANSRAVFHTDAVQAFLCYIGVLVLLLLWGKSDAFTLSIMGENGLSINLYTILFIAFFGIGYGAYYATADMPIPMVADCSDYETYRSGNYIPGIMGTLFSLVDKLVSSLSATVVGVAVSFIGLESLPTQYDPYTPGMNRVVIVLFCIIPMVAWAATLIAMKGYSLTGEKMKEIQAVNACRRDAVANGMKLEDAMTKWQTLDQLPAEYRG
mgnify:CR=1 FL=1